MKILEVTNLEKNYGDIKAVGGISFHVKKGEITGFIGPNGSGKTTTMKMITNIIFPDKGTVSICGHDLMKEREKALSHIAGIVEAPGLYRTLTGMDNMKFIAKMRNISNERLNECVEMTGLGKHLKRTVSKYSMGMKQRLALGMSMLTKPDLLILDEPTSGLDPIGTIELRNILDELSRKRNTSILFSSHQLGEVEKIADRVIFIKRGILIKEQDNLRAPAIDYVLTIGSERQLKALEVLNNIPDITEIETYKDGRVKVRLAELKLDNILTSLKESGIAIIDIERRNYDLESIFNDLYREEGGVTNV